MTFSIDKFGIIGDKEIYLFTFLSKNGSYIQISNFGGIVHSWFCPDKNGQLGDVLLGCKDLNEYQKRHPYFGALIGRYANRIANGKFKLDGIEYQLSTNLGEHHLHGGYNGLDQKIWSFKLDQELNKMILSLTTDSAHLEEGYPGHLKVKVIYTYTDENELNIEYFAESDQSTPINLTNHCYFNLSGKQDTDILDHLIKINADKFTFSNESLIPTGEFVSVNGTVLDFNDMQIVGDHIYDVDALLTYTKGFDHNFILNAHQFDTPVAIAVHPQSGRRLQVFTDQPGIQLYTGNWLGEVEGKVGKYKDFAGFCLETQHFPDSPNHDHFPNTILQREEQFYSKTIYKMDAIF
jgi:aldose 1-epimerase